MSYTYSYTTLINDELPLNKRTPIHENWLGALSKPVFRLNDLLNEYNVGSTWSSYNTLNSYSIGDRIDGGILYNNSVFEANKSTTGTFSLSDWDKVLPQFIGYEERLKYVDSRIVFEWALNRYFRTQFRQPNFTDTNKSDIYISDNYSQPLIFLVGSDDGSSNKMGLFDSTTLGPLTTAAWVGLDPVLYPGVGESFTINIGLTAYSQLPGYNGGTSSANSVITRYADTINYAGMPYRINVY